MGAGDVVNVENYISGIIRGREMHFVCYLTECKGALLIRATSWHVWCATTQSNWYGRLFSPARWEGGGGSRPQTNYSCRQSYTATPPVRLHVSYWITFVVCEQLQCTLFLSPAHSTFFFSCWLINAVSVHSLSNHSKKHNPCWQDNRHAADQELRP